MIWEEGVGAMGEVQEGIFTTMGAKGRKVYKGIY